MSESILNVKEMLRDITKYEKFKFHDRNLKDINLIEHSRLYEYYASYLFFSYFSVLFIFFYMNN